MRSALLTGPEQIVIVERPCPEPKTGEALVEVTHVAICGSDQERFWGSTENFQKPVVFGHEFSGRVASLHPSVKDFEPGQPITVAPLFNCCKCEFCCSGRENLCVKRKRFGFDIDGAMQGFLTIPTNRIFPLPDDLPIIEGALVEPLAVAYHAARIAGFEREGNTVVLGAGAIGLLIAQVWRALGGSSTSVIDIDTKRLSIASDLGIQTWTSTPADAGINTLFEASGSSAAISTWAQALDPGGRIIVVGKPNDNIRLDWVNMLRKEVQIFTSRYFTLDDFKQSQQLIINRQVDVRPLIGRTVPFEELSNQQGRIIFEQAKQMVRLVIQM